MTRDLAGKNILITQSTFFHIAGSEIVALELARGLKEMGANVKIFTYIYDDPIKSFVNGGGIDVTSDENDPFFDKLDYIWIHHQTLPERVIYNLWRKHKYNPTIIFMHMSGLSMNYLEQPFIQGLEKKLSDLNLYVSEECKNLLEKMFFNGKEVIKSGIFPNPFPDIFASSDYNHTDLKKVLVVSNHPPLEIKDIENHSRNFEIDYMGKQSKNHELITVQKLLEYDCIITIGKTVQYCLACGVPVFIYDKFGGDGYLNDKNFDSNRAVNFSGRGSTKKTTTELIKEIEDGYTNAVHFQHNNKVHFCDIFSLSENIKKYFNCGKRSKRLSVADYNTIMASISMLKWKLISEYKENVLCTRLSEAEAELQELKNSIAAINDQKPSTTKDPLYKKIIRKFKSIM